MMLYGMKHLQRSGPIGRPHVQRISIRIGVDRDRLDTHAPRGAHDATRDFAAIGDQ